jgi:sulfotransferase
MGNLLTATMRQLCQDNETSVFVDNEQRRAIFKGLFDGYYGRQHPVQTVFDTHRIWAAKIAALKDIFPDAKMICCVRHVPWIIDSLERLVYARYEAVSTGAGLVGYAWNSLRDAFYGPHNDSLMLLTYETLVTDPRRALRAVYDFIGAPVFAHDFETISFATEEFDSRLGAPGLHRVRPQISYTARRSILPPDLFARVEKDSFWREPEAAGHGVLIV